MILIDIRKMLLIISIVIPFTSPAQKIYLDESHVEGSVIERVFITSSFIDNQYDFIRDVDYNIGVDSLRAILEGYVELHYYNACLNLLNGDVYSAFQNMNSYLGSKGIKFKYEANVLMAKIEYLRLNKEQAEIRISKAIKLDKKRPEAFIEKMRFYYKEGELVAGISFAKKWSEKFPLEMEWQLYTALLKIESNQNVDGAKELEQLLNLNKLKEDVLIGEANYGLAMFYYNQNSLAKAVEYAEKALIKVPYDYFIYGFVGKCKYEEGDYNGALIAFKKMEAQGFSLEYMSIIASIYELKGDIEMACSYFKKICSWRPSDNNSCLKAKKYGCVQ